jgi:hypothetical protein
MRQLVTVALVASCFTSGCMEWKVTDRPLPEVLAKQRDSIRITSREGARVTVSHPELVADSLFGGQVIGKGKPDIPLRYAVADIDRVEVRRTNGGKTALAAIGVAATVGGTIALIKGLEDLGQWSLDPHAFDCLALAVYGNTACK